MADSYQQRIDQILTNDSFRKGTPQRTRDSATVKNVVFLTQENARQHRTSGYHLVSQLQTPIFRRGQAFSLQINFKSDFKITGENLRVDFALGPNPTPGKNTLIHLKVAATGSTSENNWSVQLKSNANNSLQLEVTPSPTAPVGVWMLTVVTQPGKDAYEVPQHLYIIFNPWCKDDQVHLENENQLYEYVLSETGIIYVGNHNEMIDRPWSYNQFFSVALPTAVYLLEHSPVPPGNRGNPIEVSRVLTRMVAYVVTGKWDTTGRYVGGISPMLWQTSNAILEKYMTQKSGVKYGQCWVFAAITCSLCRAIGIPSRVVTCFESAHDTEGNLTIDEYFDEYNNKMRLDPKKDPDSVWNFHVWNDVWMTRPDMPQGYGGWQAIDSTPQELDEKSGVYESGPASLKAIKNGEVGYTHNTMFIFSEVNADFLTWQRDQSGYFRKINVVIDRCGKYVMTKAVGMNSAEDITTQYKYLEGTQEERQVMSRAAKSCGQEERISATGPQTLSADDDVYVDILPLQSVTVGNALQVSVQVENRSPKPRIVDVSLVANSVMYTGVKVNDINISGNEKSGDKKYKQTVELAAGQKEVVNLSVTPSLYLDLLTEMGYVKFSGNATVKDTKQVWFGNDTVMAMPPTMKVETPEKLEKGKAGKVKLSFKNSMQRELTECNFSVASNCMFTTAECKFRNVKPNEDVTHEVEITPDFSGDCVIMGLFNAKNLAGIVGSKSAKVV